MIMRSCALAAILVLAVSLSAFGAGGNDENWDPFSSSQPAPTPAKRKLPVKKTVKTQRPTVTSNPVQTPAPPPAPVRAPAPAPVLHPTPQAIPQQVPLAIPAAAAVTQPVVAPVTPVSSARETSVSRLVVPLFKAHTSNRALEETWLRRRTEIQSAIIEYLNAHSFIEAVASNHEYGLNTPRDVITSETQAEGGDGVLVGEFQGTSLEISVKTAFSGRDLTSVSIPIMDLAHQSPRAVAEPAGDAIAASFRYSGYVLAVRGTEAKINLGKNQHVAVGARFDIFNFAGDNPTLSSPIQKIGELTITQAGTNAALGHFTTYAHWPVLPYSKVSPAAAVVESPEEGLKNVYRVSPRFSSYLGASFVFINTQVSPSASFGVQERIFQLPLSPALEFGLGYSGFSFESLIGAKPPIQVTVSTSFKVQRPSNFIVAERAVRPRLLRQACTIPTMA